MSESISDSVPRVQIWSRNSDDSSENSRKSIDFEEDMNFIKSIRLHVTLYSGRRRDIDEIDCRGLLGRGTNLRDWLVVSVVMVKPLSPLASLIILSCSINCPRKLKLGEIVGLLALIYLSRGFGINRVYLIRSGVGGI